MSGWPRERYDFWAAQKEYVKCVVINLSYTSHDLCSSVFPVSFSYTDIESE